MKIYTKKGDQGETSLYGGKRVLKSSLQVESYGTVDEANCCLGLARGLIKDQSMKELIIDIQKMLQILASELAGTPEGIRKLKVKVEKADIDHLEKEIDRLSKLIPKQNTFVLPGGTAGSGVLDLTRSIVRRAERMAVRLREEQEVRTEIISYLNRLSDLLFVLARVAADQELIQMIKEKVLEKLGKSSHQSINLELAKQLAAAAQKKAGELGLPVVTAIVDSAANLLFLERQDEALLASVDIAWKKAYTAASVKMPTHTLGEHAQPGKHLYGIEATNFGQIVLFGGGYPLIKEQKVWGAIGVSGGTADQDMEIASAAVVFFDKWSNYPTKS